MQAGSAEFDRSLPLRTRDIVLLALLALLALLLRLLLAARVPVIEADGAFYARLAQDALRGVGTVGFHPAWPPGYPALVALAARLGAFVNGGGVPADAPASLESAARAVSALAGALVIPVVFVLARRTVGGRAAWVTALLAVAHPGLIEPSLQVMTEMTFTLALLLALALLGPRADLRRVAMAGIIAGGALLVRPEGALLVVGLTLALLLGHQGQAKAASTRRGQALLFLILAGLVAAPHVARVSRGVGRLSIGAKTDYNLALAYAGEPGVPEIVRSRSEYNNLTGAPPLNGFPQPIPPFGLASLLVGQPLAVLRHLMEKLPASVGGLFSLATWPVALLALIGAGLRRRTATPEERTWLHLWLGYVGLYALVFVYRRFFTGFLPLLLISAALPLARALSPPGTGVARVRRGLAAAALAVLVVMGPIHAAHRIERHSGGREQRRLGEALGREASPPSRGGVAARKPTLAWYADRPILAIPEGDSAAIVAGALERGADFLVLDALDLGRERTGLRAWIASEGAAPAGWREVAHSGAGVERVRLFGRMPPEPGGKQEQVPSTPN